MQPRLSGEFVRFAVPAGWGLARIAAERNVPRAFVHLDGDCYESVSITGSSVRPITASAIDALYVNGVAGYAWSVSTAGPTIIAVLGQRNASSGALSRSALGTAYLRLARSTYLAIDFGAGIWPLNDQACPNAQVSARLPRLDGAVATIFASAHVAPPAAVPGAVAAAPAGATLHAASAVVPAANAEPAR
jgi:hypothetical protein